jgi:hypothetical protein
MSVLAVPTLKMQLGHMRKRGDVNEKLSARRPSDAIDFWRATVDEDGTIASVALRCFGEILPSTAKTMRATIWR